MLVKSWVRKSRTFSNIYAFGYLKDNKLVDPKGIVIKDAGKYSIQGDHLNLPMTHIVPLSATKEKPFNFPTEKGTVITPKDLEGHTHLLYEYTNYGKAVLILHKYDADN